MANTPWSTAWIARAFAVGRAIAGSTRSAAATVRQESGSRVIDPALSREARVRIGEVLKAFETNSVLRGEGRSMYDSPREPLGDTASRIVRRKFGVEIRLNAYDLPGFCAEAGLHELLHVVMGALAFIGQMEREQHFRRGAVQEFTEEINEIVIEDNFPMVLDAARVSWTRRVSSDLEALRRALLANPADVAECKQGDTQVEVVVSTVQARLALPRPTIVDYGAGLGRLLAGFGTAERFRNAVYVAVDDPVADDVLALGSTVGANFVPRSRQEFLESPTPADVVILLNTLHHIPFRDLPRQVCSLLASLKADGVLLIHEIGELREPEQNNVPWRMEHIMSLFDFDGLSANARSTTTKRGWPLSNILVEAKGQVPDQAAVTERTKAIWASMKQRTVDDIRLLYASHDADDQLRLHHALITNANLDLSQPE